MIERQKQLYSCYSFVCSCEACLQVPKIRIVQYSKCFQHIHHPAFLHTKTNSNLPIPLVDNILWTCSNCKREQVCTGGNELLETLEMEIVNELAAIDLYQSKSCTKVPVPVCLEGEVTALIRGLLYCLVSVPLSDLEAHYRHSLNQLGAKHWMTIQLELFLFDALIDNLSGAQTLNDESCSQLRDVMHHAKLLWDWLNSYVPDHPKPYQFVILAQLLSSHPQYLAQCIQYYIGCRRTVDGIHG